MDDSGATLDLSSEPLLIWNNVGSVAGTEPLG